MKDLLNSRKLLYVALAVGAFLALALTGTMAFTSEQTIEFLSWVLGLGVGSHALTNISAIIGQFFGRESPARPDPEPLEEEKPADDETKP